MGAGFFNKKCPFCSEIFKVRTALEAHLGTKHPDQPTGIVDIDALPNIELSSSEDGENGNLENFQQPPNPMAPFDMSTMKKYYEDTMKRFMNDLADQKQQYPNSESPANAPGLTPSQQQTLLNMAQPQNQGALDLTSSFNNEDIEDDSDPNNISHNGSNDGNANSNNKRFRTQMSGVQVKIMKAIFEAYKTPTMTECSTMGREIGLQKRVVQVWFQNARAKEKRARLQLQQATGGRDGDMGASFQPPTPDRCVVCPDFSYVDGKGCAVQDHIFTRKHLENLKIALEQGRYEPEAPGTAISQAAAAISGGNNGILSSSSPPPSLSAGIPAATRDSNALQMLQMATQSASKPTSNSNTLTNEL